MFEPGDIVEYVGEGTGPSGRGRVTQATDEYGFVHVNYCADRDGVPRYIAACELRLVSAVELLADLAAGEPRPAPSGD